MNNKLVMTLVLISVTLIYLQKNCVVHGLLFPQYSVMQVSNTKTSLKFLNNLLKECGIDNQHYGTWYTLFQGKLRIRLKEIIPTMERKKIYSGFMYHLFGEIFSRILE